MKATGLFLHAYHSEVKLNYYIITQQLYKQCVYIRTMNPGAFAFILHHRKRQMEHKMQRFLVFFLFFIILLLQYAY